MAEVMRCANEGRRQALRDQNAVNGIDYLIVVDGGEVPDELRQRLLLVRFVHPIADGALESDIGEVHRVEISGGQRVPRPRVRWVRRLAGLDAGAVDPELTPGEDTFIDALVASAVDPATWLVVVLEEYGDHSTYRFALVDGGVPPAGYDRLLSGLDFSFKVECPSPFDCLRSTVCPVDIADEPDLDYLSRDFASFRRLMFDRLALIAPTDLDREVAPLRTALVEVLAYEADRLAYFQDAVATEAYLHTARTRPSLRRHARLLGYPMHEGANARAFVQIETQGPAVAGNPITTRSPSGPGARFVTRLSEGGAVLSPADEAAGLVESPETFEALVAPPTFSPDNNSIGFYTWGDGNCCLPRGATEVWVVDQANLALEIGDFLALRQTIDPETLTVADADPSRRHVVRLVDVGDPVADDLFPGTSARLLRWHDDDALPFPMVVTVENQPVAEAAANLVLVDHGRSVHDEAIVLEHWGNQNHLRSELGEVGLTWSDLPTDPDELAAMSATAWLTQRRRAAEPQVSLVGDGETWSAARDLLRSTATSREFVVEMESSGAARLRFGDDVMGRRPSDNAVALSQLPEPVDQTDERFRATYRVGTGERGNVGAGSIAHLVADPALVDAALSAAVQAVTNPLPAVGGSPAETLAEVRRDAPEAYRVQERAVTVADWIEVTERNPLVQRALADLRWTGSWHTVFVTVDPVAEVEFEDLRDQLVTELNRYRLAGYDVEIVAPAYVPLDIALTVCIESSAYRSQVELALREEFSTSTLTDGRRGFFHPDNFTFGDSVWLSQVIARCMHVAGVRYVEVRSETHANRFKRRGHLQGTEIDDGRIRIAAHEIARCDSDPNAAEMGSIDFFVEGGA